MRAVIDVIGGKWKPVIILYHLSRGTQRFSALRRFMLGTTPKMLTQQLRELERDGVLERKAYPQVPPHVEYSPYQPSVKARRSRDRRAPGARAGPAAPDWERIQNEARHGPRPPPVYTGSWTTSPSKLIFRHHGQAPQRA